MGEKNTKRVTKSYKSTQHSRDRTGERQMQKQEDRSSERPGGRKKMKGILQIGFVQLSVPHDVGREAGMRGFT